MTRSFYNLLKEFRVVVPIMQRDYAQGRNNEKADKVRNRFVDVLFRALSEQGSTVELDFIYGHITDNNCFIPLDGQQRLTTLFLLHWYCAVKEGKIHEAFNLLKKFTYETRHSSKVFCQELIKFQPEDFEQKISETIVDQPWFFTSWQHDPTIQSMLTMLDEIQIKDSLFSMDNMWKALTGDEPKIVFHLLSMDELGNPDDLYIKMNSRGKELTEFEYFKSEFYEILVDNFMEEFRRKIDKSWSDLFWVSFRDEESKDIAKLVDDGFLRFFRYITDMLMYLENNQPADTGDISSCLEAYLVKENIEFFFSSLDSLYELVCKDQAAFFSTLFYIGEDYQEGKCRLFFLSPDVNLFKKCASLYNTSARVNPFSLGEQLLLFACLWHMRIDDKEGVDFGNTIRTLRNIIANSDDLIRKENMPALLRDVITLVEEGELPNDTKFNTVQWEEEKLKSEYLVAHPEMLNVIWRLEDHRLLQGCLAIFGDLSEIEDRSRAFHKLFSENLIQVSKALMSIGDYSQKFGWKSIVGNKNDEIWRDLLTPSTRRKHFDRTKSVLGKLLIEMAKPQASVTKIIEDYLVTYIADDNKAKDFNYYYIIYSGFNKNENGYYYWKQSEKQYECIMMRRTSLGGYHWSPFLYELRERFKDDDRVSLENYGAPLVVVKNYQSLDIENIECGYQVTSRDNNSVFEELQSRSIIDEQGVYRVDQNEEGIDIADRIEEGYRLIKTILEL